SFFLRLRACRLRAPARRGEERFERRVAFEGGQHQRRPLVLGLALPLQPLEEEIRKARHGNEVTAKLRARTVRDLGRPSDMVISDRVRSSPQDRDAPALPPPNRRKRARGRRVRAHRLYAWFRG